MAYDQGRALAWPQVESRWSALRECHSAQRDPGARPALRAALIDLAAIGLVLAAERTPPTVPPHLDSSQRERRHRFVAAGNGAV